MKTLQKTYTGKYAPNHLEFDYWIDLTADAKGSVIKTYNGTGWVEISGDSGEQIDAYTKAEVDSKFGETNATVTSIQDTVSQLYNYTIGCTEATTTASLVTDKNLVVATISANDTFSLASVPASGKEIHTIVKNSGDADIVVTIPTESPYVNLSGDNLTVIAGGHVEINAVSDGTNVYIRTL